MRRAKEKGRRTRDPHAPCEFSNDAQSTAMTPGVQAAHVLRNLVRQARGRGLHLVTANRVPDTMSVERRAER
jgi:hypothetical protein